MLTPFDIADLGHVLHFVKPTLRMDLSIRMIQLTMAYGLVSTSPLAFAYYGAVLVVVGRVRDGCRLGTYHIILSITDDLLLFLNSIMLNKYLYIILFAGRLALKLVENKLSLVNKSAVIVAVYFGILWTCEPLQSCSDAHEIGRRVGQQTGDYLYTQVNWQVSLGTRYFVGESLETLIAKLVDFIATLQSQDFKALGFPVLLYHQARVLKGGLCESDVKPPNNILTEAEAYEGFCNVPVFLIQYKIHQLVRAYLFRRLDDAQSRDIVDISDLIEKNKHPMHYVFLFGVFFEGLASYLLARRTNDSEQKARWSEKGENVLTKMKYWSEHSSWNWESKMVLLEAEKMYTVGSYEQASLFYDRAIRLAHDHKFINDEAIVSELAGVFFFERELHAKAEALLLHSVECYKIWGALAVARRVETYIVSKFGADRSSLDQGVDVLKGILAVSQDDSSKKRQVSM